MIKNLIGSVPYLLQVKGFRHGSGGLPRDTAYAESTSYNDGYMDGLKAKEDYIKELNKVCYPTQYHQVTALQTGKHPDATTPC